MQSKMEKVQAEIAAMDIEGQAGGGMVTVHLDGKGVMTSIKIDPSMFKEDDVEILEDLIVAATRPPRTRAKPKLRRSSPN